MKTTRITHLSQRSFAFCKVSRLPDNSRMTCSVKSKIVYSSSCSTLKCSHTKGALVCSGMGALLMEGRKGRPNRIRRLDINFLWLQATDLNMNLYRSVFICIMKCAKFLWGDGIIFIYWRWIDIKTKQNKNQSSCFVRNWEKYLCLGLLQ